MSSAGAIVLLFDMMWRQIARQNQAQKNAKADAAERDWTGLPLSPNFLAQYPPPFQKP